MQLLEQCTRQDVPWFGEAAGRSPRAAGAAASFHVVNEDCSKIDQYFPPGDDADSVPDFPVAGLVSSAVAPAQSFQALVGVPSGVQVDVFVNCVLAVPVDRPRADEIA